MNDPYEVQVMDELIAILQEIHPDVDYETATNLVDGKILGEGSGRSKKAAEQQAAKMALARWGKK